MMNQKERDKRERKLWRLLQIITIVFVILSALYVASGIKRGRHEGMLYLQEEVRDF